MFLGGIIKRKSGFTFVTVAVFLYLTALYSTVFNVAKHGIQGELNFIFVFVFNNLGSLAFVIFPLCVIFIVVKVSLYIGKYDEELASFAVMSSVVAFGIDAFNDVTVAFFNTSLITVDCFGLLSLIVLAIFTCIGLTYLLFNVPTLEFPEKN